MEANELFIFRWSLLSLRTHGCNNLFIPPAGKRPLLDRVRERERARETERVRESSREWEGW